MYITKSELARIYKVSPAYISKLVKKGIFDHCMDGKKLKRDCAIQSYLENKDPTRESQRQANNRNKDVIDIEENIDESIKNSSLYNEDNLSELKIILQGVKTPYQRVQVMASFWNAKLTEHKYEVEKGKYYAKEEIDKKAEYVIVSAKNKFLGMPSKVAPLLVGIKNIEEAELIVSEAIYEILKELSNVTELV